MTDPFRAELTAAYIVRENHDWAAAERVASAGRKWSGIATLAARLTSVFARAAARQPRPEIQMLPRRERPAA